MCILGPELAVKNWQAGNLISNQRAQHMLVCNKIPRCIAICFTSHAHWQFYVGHMYGKTGIYILFFKRRFLTLGLSLVTLTRIYLLDISLLRKLEHFIFDVHILLIVPSFISFITGIW